MVLTLYDEALLYKKKGEIALNRGDLESARIYFLKALEKLKILYHRSDPSLKNIWLDPINKLEKIIREIAKIASRQKRVIPTSLPSVISKPEVQSMRMPEPSAVEAPRVYEIPEICNQDFIVAEKPNLSFNDLAGFEKVKQELTENIEWPLKYPDKLNKLGVTPIKGILLFGPPGCGKTYIVKCAAGQFNITLMRADPASILSKYVGEAEKTVRIMFECASKLAPSIVFIDEVDKFLPAEVHGTDAIKRVEAQFLQEMDGISSNSGFITVMATNEPWNLTPALIRPGRVDKIIYVPPPDAEARKRLFELYLKGVELEKNVKIKELVKLTEPNEKGYYSSSGIKTICDEAKRNLFREWIRKGVEVPMPKKFLIDAIKNVPRSITHQMIKKYENWAKQHASYIA